MSEKKVNRGYLSSTLGCHCPRCREGKLFKNSTTISFKRNMLMNKECPVCNQATEIEVGFYYGTSYVSYVLAVAICVSSLVAWWVLIGFSTTDNRFFIWLAVNAVLLIILQPWLMRISRSLWISERMNADQANNW
jgi:uncharacterized protein (DUF983 family)